MRDLLIVLKNDLLYEIFNQKLSESDKALFQIIRNYNKFELDSFVKKATTGDEKDLNSEIVRDFFNCKIGILCLTESFDNLTMWSHYADNHKGFVLGFNPEKNITDPAKCFIKLKKINYTYNRPSITYFDFSKDKKTRKHNLINDIFYTKGKDWAYENEWRQVNKLSDADKIIEDKVYLFNYNIESVESIYLGWNMNKENELEILNCVKDLSLSVFKMKLHPESYCLEKQQLK